MSGELSAIQTRAVALLDAVSYFGDILVAELSDGSISQRLQQALTVRGLGSGAGGKPVKPGIAVIVAVHQGRALPADRGGKPLRLVHALRAAVLENPLVNLGPGGNGKRPLEVVPEIIRAWHRQPVSANAPGRGAGYVLEPAEPLYELLGEPQKQQWYGVSGGLGLHVHFEATARIAV